MCLKLTFLKNIFTLSLLLLPGCSYAEIEITEIMYDAAGSDTKKEWIEIYNRGDSSIDISQWHFFEAGVHHGLEALGFESLNPGEYAVVVADANFTPSNFVGNQRVKSSFSLSNQGENLGISNPEKELFFEYSYQPEEGSSGTGSSLQNINGSWRSSIATPGTTNIFSAPISQEPALATNTNRAVVSKKQATGQSRRGNTKEVEYHEIGLNLVGNMIAGEELLFDLFKTHHKNGRGTVSPYGYFYVNFGDGGYFKGQKDKSLKKGLPYVYQYPGEYTVVAKYYSSAFAYENGVEPKAEYQIDLSIEGAKVAIVDVKDDASIHFKNDTASNIDLGGWSLATGGSRFFTFPEETLLRSGGSLVVGSQRHGISFFESGQNLVLRNSDGYTVNHYKYDAPVTVIKKTRPVSVTKNRAQPIDIVPGSEVRVLDETEYYLAENSKKDRVDFGEDARFYGLDSDAPNPTFPTGLVGLLGLTSVALVALRQRKESLSTTVSQEEVPFDGVIGEIELIEE